MGLFKRNKSSKGNEDAQSQSSNQPQKEKKPGWLDKPPLDSRLRQQRLPGFEPIYTPKLAILLFFLAAVIFAPIGAVLYVDSTRVNELTYDYTECYRQSSTPSPIPKYEIRVDARNAPNGSEAWPTPQWAWVDQPSAPNGKVCQIDFYVPMTFQKSVYFYYKLTNYYQAHRRYLRSFDSDQLLGHRRSLNDLKSQTCKPVHNYWRTYENGTRRQIPIYPCGLIPNSVFNDTFYQIQRTNGINTETTSTYPMSEKGLVWSGEMEKYKRSKYNYDQVAPPPYWQGAKGRFGIPSGMYNASNFFDPTNNEHFAVWMRAAGLPVIRKLYMRNDHDDLVVGSYRIQLEDNYPVAQFKGTKSFVISTANWTGGRNPFLGITCISVAAFCFAVALLITILQVVRPRRLGDPKNLSWNKPGAWQQ